MVENLQDKNEVDGKTGSHHVTCEVKGQNSTATKRLLDTNGSRRQQEKNTIWIISKTVWMDILWSLENIEAEAALGLHGSAAAAPAGQDIIWWSLDSTRLSSLKPPGSSSRMELLPVLPWTNLSPPLLSLQFPSRPS